jgi:hypothetical protein
MTVTTTFPATLLKSHLASHARVCLCFPRSICTTSGTYSPPLVPEHELKP